MARFLFKCIMFLAGVLAVLVGVNYFVDPAGLFRNAGLETGVADNLLKGRSVTRIINCNERRLHKALIQRRQECPRAIVLGSSRSLLLRKDHFSDTSFFNHSMTGAMVHDLVGLYQLYSNRACKPKQVVMAIEPWYFNINSKQRAWLNLDQQVRLFSGGLSASKWQVMKYNLDRVISMGYFQESVSVLKTMRHARPVVTTDSVNADYLTRIPDGSVNYPSTFEHVDASEVDARVKKFISRGEIYALGGYTSLEPQYVDLFEKLVSKIRSDGGKPVVLLMPYHPTVYAFLISDPKYKMVQTSENYLRTFCAVLGVEVVGSYDPAACESSADDFLDAMHLNAVGLSKFLNRHHQKF